MMHEYEGIEKEFLIRDAGIEAEHYEKRARLCLPRILDGSAIAYALMLHYAARVGSYHAMIGMLRQEMAKE
jgi:hypothetical protein